MVGQKTICRNGVPFQAEWVHVPDSGYPAPHEILLDGWEYRINGGEWLSEERPLQLFDVVEVREPVSN